MNRSSAGSLNHRDGDPARSMWSVYGFNDVFGISSRAVVMFLVEDVQRNIFDQRCVEIELWNR